MTRLSSLVPTLCALASAPLAVASPQSAGGPALLTPIDQSRAVNGTASVGDGVESDSDSDFTVAPDLAPFVASAFASASIFNGQSSGGGSQDSRFLDDAIMATGSAFSNGTVFDPSASASANGSSGAVMVFSVNSNVIFRASGYLNAFDSGSGSISLRDASFEPLFEVGAFGPSERVTVDEFGLLVPGAYVLSIFADAPSQASFFTPGFASAEYGLTLALEDELGPRLCSPAVPNSTGSPGTIVVVGSDIVADDDLTLLAIDLPALSNIGYFLMGTGTNTFTPPGSAGPICVAPGIQRYLPPVANTHELPGGFVRSVGTSGPVSGSITVGSTWGFQAWHRDFQAGTSNLTDAVRVTFR